MKKSYISLQRLEGNESPVFVDVSVCAAVVVHRKFHSEAEHFSDLFLFFSSVFPPKF